MPLNARWTLPLAALGGALLGAGAMAWLAPPRDDAHTGAVVRRYLLAHPEVIPEAMARYQPRADAGKQQIADTGLAALSRPFAGAWSGNPNGDVTVVEFFDYNCGYCRASLPAIRDLVASDPKVRVVYRELPILSPESRTAARTSLAAAIAGRYAAFHDALYAAGPVSDASIAAAARSAGIAAPTGATLARVERELAANLAAARELGVNGTPSWIVGDQLVAGAQTLASLQAAVAAARAAR